MATLKLAICFLRRTVALETWLEDLRARIARLGIGGISKTNDRIGNMEKSKVLYINEIVSCYQIIVIYKYI